jgi:hypothetical protein
VSAISCQASPGANHGLFMRILIFVLLTATALAGSELPAQQDRLRIRVSTTYAFVDSSTVDTATASRRFVAGLTADSLLSVLPPVTPEMLATRIGRQQAAQYVVSLAVSRTATQSLVRVRVLDVEKAQEVFGVVRRVRSQQPLVDALDTLGRRVAREFARRSTAKRPPANR